MACHTSHLGKIAPCLEETGAWEAFVWILCCGILGKAQQMSLSGCSVRVVWVCYELWQQLCFVCCLSTWRAELAKVQAQSLLGRRLCLIDLSLKGVHFPTKGPSDL